MPEYSQYYNLLKPMKSENYDIEDVTNKNADIIDSELEKRVEKIEGKGLSTNDFTDEYVAQLQKVISEESKRKTAENERVINESNRKNNEILREAEEKERISNEENRKTSEIQREEYITELKLRVENGEFKGDPNVLKIGKVEKGEEASASIEGDSPNQTLNLVLPKGDKGEKGNTGETGATGPANVLKIGTVEKGDEAKASITGNSPEQILNLTLPKGDKGEKGDSFKYSDFTPEELETLKGPKGDPGIKGDPGEKGNTGEPGKGVSTGGKKGQILSKISNTDYDTEWIDNIYKYILTISADTPDNSVLTIPTGYYQVGNGSLRVYFMGEPLVKDIHYTEVGVSGSISNQIQIKEWGETIDKGFSFIFEINGKYEV